MFFIKHSVAGTDPCHGCGVCAAICPKGCIAMKQSREGFWVPRVNAATCIGCGQCVRLCPTRNPIPREALHQRVVSGVAAWLKDAALLRASSSGGAIGAIVQALAGEGYGFCGVRYAPEHLRAEHFLAETPEAFAPARGSKYLQSLTVPAFREMLTGEKKWLVVGTPCQIAAFRRVIQTRGMEDRFFLVDFVCHGVPSAKLWEAFLRRAAKDHNPHDLDAIWRGKTRGWQDSWELRLTDNDGKTVYVDYATQNNLWYRHFLRCTAQNLPCYSCPFVGTHSGADIRVRDFWGERFKENTAGVSRVEVYTARGVEVWEHAATFCETEPLSSEEIAAVETKMPCATPPAWGRKTFIRLLDWPNGFIWAHRWSLIGCAWARLRRLIRK